MRHGNLVNSILKDPKLTDKQKLRKVDSTLEKLFVSVGARREWAGELDRRAWFLARRIERKERKEASTSTRRNRGSEYRRILKVRKKPDERGRAREMLYHATKGRRSRRLDP